jgi:signal peptidase I
MATDDWWTQAVDQFGLDSYLAPTQPDGVDDDVQPARPRRRRRRLAIELLIIAVLALGTATLLRLFVVQHFAVEGRSMLGTLHSGDRVLVNKLSYRLHDPRHGDIVVLEDITQSVDVRDLIKRVIALPGETVEYRDCDLFINGNPVAEPYLDPLLVAPGRCGDPQPPVTVEARHVFVMGDNRSDSFDSRTPAIGQISFSNLVGRANVVVRPASAWRWQ